MSDIVMQTPYQTKPNFSGLKFCYLDFTRIAQNYKGMCVYIDGKEVAQGEFGDVLDILTAMEDEKGVSEYEIVETRRYFDLFVVELTSAGY